MSGGACRNLLFWWSLKSGEESYRCGEIFHFITLRMALKEYFYKK